MRRPRIADVAREAGVSKTAVSFAFNSPDRLSPETLGRIRTVAETLGYRPHPVARMLSQRQTLTIGVLTPQALSVVFSNPFFGAFTEGVALGAEQSGYALHFISPVHGSLARAIGRATVDGVVAIGLSSDHPELASIRDAGLPIVLVDSAALPELPSVVVDDEGGAEAAARHLLELGHRDLLVLGVQGPPPSGRLDADGVTSRRLAGYRAALLAAGIDLSEERVLIGAATFEAGAAAVERAWAAGITATGILAMSDALAIGAIRGLRTLGLEVPRDVSVVGFDDIDIAVQTHPPLTTVHQPTRAKGEQAVELLLSVVTRRDVARPPHRRLETRLIIRGSTAPAAVRREEVAGIRD